MVTMIHRDRLSFTRRLRKARAPIAAIVNATFLFGSMPARASEPNRARAAEAPSEAAVPAAAAPGATKEGRVPEAATDGVSDTAQRPVMSSSRSERAVAGAMHVESLPTGADKT